MKKTESQSNVQGGYPVQGSMFNVQREKRSMVQRPTSNVKLLKYFFPSFLLCHA
jgi:hypothetical protein